MQMREMRFNNATTTPSGSRDFKIKASDIISIFILIYLFYVNQMCWFFKSDYLNMEYAMVSSEFQQCVQKCGDVAKYGYPYWNLCSAINPSKVHTHSSEHTHTPGAVGSHLRCGSPGSSWRFGGLAQGHLSHSIEGGESAVHSLPHLQSLPDMRLEPTTFGLRVRLWLIR